MIRIHGSHWNCSVCGGSNDLCLLQIWNQPVCYSHSYDGTPRCCACGRFREPSTRFINLGDHRQLCTDCFSNCILDKKGFENVISEIHNFFEKLKLKVDKDIPILLVDHEQLIERWNKNVNPPVEENLLSGLTVSPGSVLRVITECLQNGENIEVMKEIKQLTVTSILILFGFPRMITGAILAHEMMHAWFRLQGLTGKLERIVEEGMCDVISLMWLKEIDFDDQTESEKKLKDFYINNREQDEDIVYGDGFRNAKSIVENFGLENTLKQLAKNGKFPRRRYSLWRWVQKCKLNS